MLRLWSLIYRLTGWYSPWARVAEYKAVREWLASDESFLTIAQLGADALDVFIGTWQAEHGFYRKYKWRKL